MAASLVGMPTAQHAWGEAQISNPVHIPTGNFLASRLRNIYNDTSRIFPASAHSGRREAANRWRSLVHSDFCEKDIRAAWIRGKKPQTTLPITDPGLDQDKVHMFMQWKVPPRIVGAENSSDAVERIVINSRTISPQKTASRSSSQSHQSQRFHTSLPIIAANSPSRSHTRCSGSVESAVKTPRLATPMSRSAPVKKSKAVARKELLVAYADHDVPTKADAMLRYATPRQKQQITKALQIADECAKPVIVRDVVNTWMSNASNRDRQVALDFFQSIAGHKLLGRDDMKAMEVVTELKRGIQTGKQPTTLSRDPEEEARLRHIRLLTPDTRRSKEQHQTWHHLPSYRNENTVMNNSGIYNSTTSYIPRHFTIHPDWGP